MELDVWWTEAMPGFLDTLTATLYDRQREQHSELLGKRGIRDAERRF